MLWAYSALLCGVKGKQRDAVSARQVKEWANPQHVLRRGLVVFWPAKKNNMEKEGGRETRGAVRSGQVRSGQVKSSQVRVHRVGLVWFGLVLALVLGLAAVRCRAVRCGAGCGCMRRREMSQVGVLFQVELPRYPSRNHTPPPLSLWSICLVRVAATVWSGGERGPAGDEARYWIATDGPGPFSSPTRYTKEKRAEGAHFVVSIVVYLGRQGRY